MMGKFILRRLLLLVIQMFILGFVLFFLMIPRDGVYQWVELDYYPYFEVIPTSVDFLNLLSHYWFWLRNGIFRGDFGWSWSFHMPVAEIIARRLPNTLRLLTVTLLIIYGVGIPLGIIGGKNSNSLRDRMIMMFTQMSSSLPAFTMGYILILTFALSFRWFPFMGSVSIQAVTHHDGTLLYHLSRIHHVILPALSLALVQLIIPAKFLRGGIVDTMKLPFITTARAKGVKRRNVFKKHVFANAIPPIIATFPMQIVTLLSGMIIVEIVFAFPGVGGLLWTAFGSGDTNLLMVLALILAMTVLSLNVIADLLLLKLDPRVEFEKN